MLETVAELAREFDLPCQVSLEEFMACAVGGCAGCAVMVQTESGPAMKRVCVDGPVFEAGAVRSKQAYNFSAGDMQRNRFDDLSLLIGFGQFAGFE